MCQGSQLVAWVCLGTFLCFRELQRLLQLLAFLASTDAGTVADHVRLQAFAPHLAQKLQRLLPLLTLLASADAGIVAPL